MSTTQIPGLEQINALVTQNLVSNGNTLGGPITLTSLLNSLNNINEIANGVNKTWSGPDPLLTNMFFFQTPFRNGNYIPAAFVKKVDLPERSLVVEQYMFRGCPISYVRGINVGDFQVTFFENQEMQISGFFEAWKAYGAAPGGSFYGLNNELKYNMFFVYTNSQDVSTETTIGNTLNQILPSGMINTLGKLNFSGIALLIGCFPRSNPMNGFMNPPEVMQQEVTVTFQVDEIFKFPISADLQSILEIAGISRYGGTDLF